VDRWCTGRFEEIGNRLSGYSPGIQSAGTLFYGKPELILDCSTKDDAHVLDCHQQYLSAVISILNEKCPFIEHSCIQSFILINAIYPITKTLCMTLEVAIQPGYGR